MVRITLKDRMSVRFEQDFSYFSGYMYTPLFSEEPYIEAQSCQPL